MTRKPIVVAGPTASGKTAFALRLARAVDGELVGADSVQVFRGFDIGSAKPTRSELGSIRHHLIDVLDPDQPIDAARYAALADEAVRATRDRGKVPIVVGGTGLWIRAWHRGLFDAPPVDPTIRGGLETQAEQIGSDAMHVLLKDVDEASANTIHPNDTRRIVRALEVHAQTGIPLSEHQRQHALGKPRYDALFMVIDPPKDVTTSRIERRVDSMLELGWVDEVRRLITRWGSDVRPLQSVGYRQLVEHVVQETPLEQTRAKIAQATRLYARRQRTWFAGQSTPDVRLQNEELTAQLLTMVERHADL